MITAEIIKSILLVVLGFALGYLIRSRFMNTDGVLGVKFNKPENARMLLRIDTGMNRIIDKRYVVLKVLSSDAISMEENLNDSL